MTSLSGFVLIAASCLIVHVALATELLVDRDGPVPRPVRLLARAPGVRRSRTAASLAVAVLVGIQLLMLGAIVAPDRFAGSSGALVAFVEILLAGLWVLFLIPRRSQQVGRL